MTPEQFDLLFERFVAGRLTPEEGEALRASLADPSWQRRWRDLSDLDGALAQEFRVAPGTNAPARPRLRLRPATGAAAGPARTLALAAAAAVLLVGLGTWLSGGDGRRGLPVSPALRPAPSRGADEPARPDAQEEYARLEAEGRRIQERLDVLERRRRDLRTSSAGVEPAPVEAPPGGDSRKEDLTRIEADRQAVEAEMARMVEAMRRAREALADAAPGPFVPAPSPSAAPSPLPGAPRETRVALATLERVDGEVFLIDAGGARTRAASSRPLEAAQGVAVGAGVSRAAVAFADGTRLELAADTELSRIDDGPAGKRIRVERGRLAVEAARQPAGKTVVFETPHAEARVVGTAFTLDVHPESTALAVREGRVRLVRRAGGAAVDVGAGQHAAAAPGAGLGPFRSTPFVLGVNFNGEAVSVEGRRWSSYREALAAGLRVTPEPACTSTGVLPSPAVDDATGAMLNTAVFGRERSLALAQPLPNGAYDVFLWVMENLDDDHRTFDVVVEGKSRLRNIGPGMKRGEWVRLGPVRAVVADGALDVELVAKRTDPHLMGMAVYRADPR